MSEPRTSVLVVGATSPVGRAIVRVLRENYEVVGTHHHHPSDGTVPYDLGRDTPASIAVDWSRFRAVVLAGGVTKLDVCAADPQTAAKVNVDGNVRLATHALAHDVLPVFLSSDAVFSGELQGDPIRKTEADPVGPGTVYGKQKKAVEDALRDTGSTILRLTKLVSIKPRDGGFLFDMAESLKQKRAIQAATDQFMNLTWTEDVARVVDFVIPGRAPGVWHVAAQPARSRYQWALSLAEALGADHDLVRPCSLDDFDFPERRARDSSLDGSRLQARLPWRLREGEQLIVDVASSA